MAPPAISVAKFSGLATYAPNDEGDFSQLIRAENAQFNRAGQIEARRGFHFFTNLPTGNQSGRCLGKLTPPNPITSPTRMFLGNTRYHKWAGDKHDPSLASVGALAPNAQNTGAQYAGVLYFLDALNWNGTTISLTTGQPATGRGAICAHNERIWVAPTAGAFPCRLYFSAVGDPENWPSDNFIDVGPGDGGAIVDLRSYRNRLYIFKTKSLWILETPGAPTSWSLRRYSYDGCVGQSSIEHEGILYWFGREGAYRHDGSSIKVISEPIADVWNDNEVTDDSFAQSAVYDDMWVFWIWQNGNQKVLCFHTKLEQWTEWTFDWQTPTTYVESIWAEPIDDGGFTKGFYLGVHNTTHGMIVGIEFGGTANPFLDELGSRIGADSITQYPYDVTIQTKWSDFGDPLSKKRVKQWMVETDGGDMRAEQIDGEQRQVEQYLIGTGGYNDNITVEQRFRGIGYFRKLSLRLTITNFATVGWKLHGLWGDMSVKGKQIKNESQTFQ